MEQHPIPQDVTGFQFKLIGTMTVKQFGYVAVGAILAVLFWYAPAQNMFWHIIFKGLLTPTFGILGVVAAFVPIEGRPVDVMAANFFHALVTPNQYIYIKKGRKLSFARFTLAKAQPATTAAAVQKPAERTFVENKKEKQLRALLSGSYKDARSNLDKREMAFLQSIDSVPMPASQPAPVILQTQPASFPKPTIQTQITEKIPPLTQNIQAQTPVKKELPSEKPANSAQQQINQKAIDEMNVSHQKVLELQKQTQDIHAQKEQVEQELLRLKNQMSAQKTTVSPTDLQSASYVHNVPQNMIKSSGFSHVSDTPNVIVGIIKDSRGNILPNILVEVKDKDGNPVRAFKTNPLGQFASATPLSSGNYSIELEDPKKLHAFDVIAINANGQIMLPLEIISHDAREELRKALFN